MKTRTKRSEVPFKKWILIEPVWLWNTPAEDETRIFDLDKISLTLTDDGYKHNDLFVYAACTADGHCIGYTSPCNSFDDIAEAAELMRRRNLRAAAYHKFGECSAMLLYW